jgi:hypothetical protein
LQTGAGVTFWVKTARQDLESALFSFGDLENETSPNFYFTENAHLSYTVKGQLETLNLDVNNPSSVKTNAIGEGWHYVALQLLSNGYTLYVDGIKEAEQTLVSERSTSFSYQTLLNHLTTAPYFYLAAGSETALVESWFDDINFYTNSLTSKEITRPKKGLFASTTTETFEYIVGDPITSVGSADCSAGWWTTFSNYYRIPENASMKFEFINHTSGVNNWNNWNLCVATDAERDGAGYDEYFVIRSDLYGWGGSYNAENWSSEGYDDWDLFRQNMEGATVDVTLVRSGSLVTVTAVANCLSGKVYKETFKATCGDGTDVIRAFFIVDGSYLEFVPDACQIMSNVEVATPSIGSADCSAGWWTTFSDYFEIPANHTLTLNFINHTSGVNNWNNWNLCVATDAERDGAGYDEYFVIRSDLYGWGGSYNASNWSSEGYGDWDLFRQNMEGADVTITITRKNEMVYVTAVATCTDGTVYTEWFNAVCGDGLETINAFLIVDGSYLEMKAANCFLSTSVY